ncbi:MAG: FmdE family protein [Bacillota bacterium]
MNNSRQKLWEKCVDFHGHACPGLAIGFKACEAAGKKIDIKMSRDEELVCVTETDACGIDAIQYITGCTAGKGNLIYRKVGKHAFSFFARESGNKIRLVWKNIKDDFQEREEKIQWILSQEADKLFNFKSPHYNIPDKAEIFETVECEKCGEGTAEFAIRLQQGKKVCLDCYDNYSSGWMGKN